MLVLITFLFKCKENNDFRLSPDCYKLDYPTPYLEGLPEGNTTVWAVTHGGNEVEVGCSWQEAYIYMWNYNCDNHPNEFSDIYVVFRANGTPCKE